MGPPGKRAGWRRGGSGSRPRGGRLQSRNHVGVPARAGQGAGRRSPLSPSFSGRHVIMAQTLTARPGKLQVSPRIEQKVRDGELTPPQVEEFRDFLAEVERDLMQHRVITNNLYTRWF